MISHVKVRREGQGRCSDGSRSLGNIMSCCVVGSGETQSSMALLSN